jgi:hypothetical protein
MPGAGRKSLDLLTRLVSLWRNIYRTGGARKTMADEQQRPKFRYQDMPELRETFADGIGGWTFDGSTLRVEFLVSRLDQVKQGETPSGRSVPACRLVLTTAAAVELIRTASQVTAALTQAGVLRQADGKPGTN